MGVYKLVDPAPLQEPSDDAINRAVNIIKQAKKPLIILGKGAAYDKTEKQVQELINKTDIPFLPMSMAKGLVPDDDKHSAAAARSLSLKNADVVILIGARLNMLFHGAYHRGAVGWMIGECGGVPPKEVLTVFLRDHHS